MLEHAYLTHIRLYIFLPKVYANLNENAGRLNPANGYGECPDGVQRLGCSNRKFVRCSSGGMEAAQENQGNFNMFGCFCKKKGTAAKRTNFEMLPKECTAVNKYLFFNNGDIAGKKMDQRGCGNPNTDGSNRFPCYCKRGFCKTKRSCTPFSILTPLQRSKCVCLHCNPGYYYNVNEMVNGHPDYVSIVIYHRLKVASG